MIILVLVVDLAEAGVEDMDEDFGDEDFSGEDPIKIHTILHIEMIFKLLTKTRKKTTSKEWLKD
jgi:hypothetical protein